MKVINPDLAISNRTDIVVHRVALTATVAVVVYGLLTSMTGWGISQNYWGHTATIILSLIWLTYGIWQFGIADQNQQSSRLSLTRLTVLHLLAAAYAIGVVDFVSPLIFLWSLLIVAGYLYLGLIGSIASVAGLLTVTTVNLTTVSAELDVAINTVLAAIVTSSVGLVAIFIVRSSQADQREIKRSKDQVSLQQNRTTTLINNLADAVISTDRFGTVTLYNAATLNLLDTNTSIIGKNIDRVLSTRTVDGTRLSCWEMLHQSTTVTTRDDIVTRVSDEQIRLEMTFSPVRGNYSSSDNDEAHGGYVIILRDITKTKSLEEERDEFISVVSHELRTPITIAEGTLSNVVLMMDKSDTVKSRLIDTVKTAHEQVIFLARMVNDLSTLSRAERGIADEAEEIDIDAMIHDLFNEHHAEASDKKLSFDLNISGKAGKVLASRLYLKELLQNFITNAIKYTREGGITVKVSLRKGIVTISVTDTGIGMSKADQRRIFDKFYRAEDYRTRETNGTGLGLYVAEKLARKLGTTIQVTSRLNHGSTFSINLPSYNPSTKKPATNDADSRAAA